MTGVEVRYGDGTMGEVRLVVKQSSVFWRSGVSAATSGWRQAAGW